jgi:hypothetical protein
MGIELVSIGTKGAKIWRDQANPWKIFGAIGEGARSWALRAGLPCDDTTLVPTELISTVTGTSPLTAGVADGYPLLATTGATEYNGINAQLRGAVALLGAGKEAFFRAKAKLSQANTADFLLGLCELKTDLMKVSAAHGVLATGVEGAFFVKPSGATTLFFKVYKDGVETSSVNLGAATTDDTDYAIWAEGTRIHAYLNNVEVANVVGVIPDGVLTPSFNVRAGASAAITLSFAEMAFAYIG